MWFALDKWAAAAFAVCPAGGSTKDIPSSLSLAGQLSTCTRVCVPLRPPKVLFLSSQTVFLSQPWRCNGGFPLASQISHRKLQQRPNLLLLSSPLLSPFLCACFSTVSLSGSALHACFFSLFVCACMHVWGWQAEQCKLISACSQQSNSRVSCGAGCSQDSMPTSNTAGMCWVRGENPAWG